ncbi:MAG: serine--tRNA ligase [Candidatus Sumerlaeia bacterium]|nr:serine--tRNA ligase [Candidatus Sumerlaeia bacterium]
MLDIRLFRENPDQVKERLATRGMDGSAVDEVLALDGKRRETVSRTEALKATRNQISKEIPQRAKAGESIDELKEQSRQIGEEIATLDGVLRDIDEELRLQLLSLPNLPHGDAPIGEDESGNKLVRSWGEPIKHPFAAKAHWDLGDALGFLDLPRGAKVSGSGFYVLKGIGARLERALISWLLDVNTTKNGYTECSVPFVVSPDSLTGTGNLPKFEDQLYKVPLDNLYLIPTAEVPLTNLWAGEILDSADLPIAVCAHTPCFRREAGAAGRENRGISRVHQFHKVELVHLTTPEESAATHEKLVGHACGLLEELGVPYRVVELCTGDLGFGATKCYDLEIWAPGMETWLEVSSCSNFGDFQARRANIRYRPDGKGKPQFVHTLNGSGLALPRLMISLLENNQREDGSIAIPKVLQDRVGASEIRA